MARFFPCPCWSNSNNASRSVIELALLSMKKISLLAILTTFLGGVLSILAQSVTFVDPVIEESARSALGVAADQNVTEGFLRQ